MTEQILDIASDRLILRPPVPEDVDVVNRELAKWDIAKMLASAPHPYPPEPMDKWWQERKARMFPVEGLWRMLSLKDDPARTCVGNVALCPRDGKWQLGFWLAEDQWGKGLMSEAVISAVVHVLAHWQPKEIVSGALTDNPASRKILEKAGFTYTGTSDEWCEARQKEVPHWNFRYVS